MTYEERGDLFWRYEFGPERVLQNIFAVDSNVELLIKYAAAHGQRCKHWIFTFKDVEDLDQCIKDWGTFLRRLRAKTGVCGLRVFEWGRKTGRFHVHVVFDRYLDLGLVNHLKADLSTMGHAQISKKDTDGHLAKYLWKELSKQLRHRRVFGRRRLWATFGRLAEFSGAKDIIITRTSWVDGVNIGDPWKEAKRNAWATRVPGESKRKTWGRAWWLYWHDPRWEWSEEGLRSIERMLAEHFGEDAPRGDAYEDRGGSVDFEPAELEKTGAGSPEAATAPQGPPPEKG